MQNSTGEEILGQADHQGRTSASRSRTGRRPGDSGTRDAILAAARRQFAELGFDRTSVRAIAQAAAVDPGLITHFFGSKQALFVQSVELPFQPAQVLPQLLAGDVEQLGVRLARFMVGVMGVEQARERMIGLVRAAASEPEAARLVRDLVTRELFTPLAEAIGAPEAPLRATLIGAHVVGLTFARYIVGVQPLAAAEAEVIVAATAPVLQHYLTGPINGPAPAAG